ncbi:MAG: sce7726 family protein [Lachnospiraceae bacterium]|nr:sce7726 family protein [Lachnospiraceae bacterium]
MIYDKDIREPLFDFLEEAYGKVRIIEEKTIGKSRADVFLVLPEEIWGLEIKSDADTYTRLARQVKDYDRFFDRNMVVVGTSHAMHIEEHVPEHWGIITVDPLPEGPDFYILRQPSAGTKTSWERKLSMLWRPELVMLQETFGMPRYKDKSKAFVVKAIAEKAGTLIEEEALKKEFSRLLFERDYTEIAGKIEAFREENKRSTTVERKPKRRRKRKSKKI